MEFLFESGWLFCTIFFCLSGFLTSWLVIAKTELLIQKETIEALAKSNRFHMENVGTLKKKLAQYEAMRHSN